MASGTSQPNGVPAGGGDSAPAAETPAEAFRQAVAEQARQCRVNTSFFKIVNLLILKEFCILNILFFCY